MVKIELNKQILFKRPNCLFIGRIVRITEKAVQVDYCLEPTSLRVGMLPITVFTHSCYIPKSVLIEDTDLPSEYSCTTKKWFASTFNGGYHIRKYYMEGDKINNI